MLEGWVTRFWGIHPEPRNTNITKYIRLFLHHDIERQTRGTQRLTKGRHDKPAGYNATPVYIGETRGGKVAIITPANQTQITFITPHAYA
jgi:hypothetical protein